VGYPFLTFLVLRRSFGRVGWLAFAYMLLVAFSVMYTGDHWLIDCIGGVAYAYVSYYVVTHAAAAQALLARVADDSPVGRSWSALRR
jgi:membrane-associated phospholipid phosphatase